MSDSDDLERLIGVIVNHGQSQFYSFGLLLGFSDSKITAAVAPLPTSAGKLRVMIEMRRAAVASSQLKTELLGACERLPNPILGVVLEALNSAGINPGTHSPPAAADVATGSAATGMARNGDVRGEYAELAERVRGSVDLFGNPWDGWSDIPGDIFDFACSATADRLSRLAEVLEVSTGQRTGMAKSDVPPLSSRDILSTWIRREDPKLEKLFEKIKNVDVLGQLSGMIRMRMTGPGAFCHVPSSTPLQQATD